MAENRIFTKIALKYNDYAYWTNETLGEGKGAFYVPLKGEVCFCAIENKNQGAQTAPTVLFKVGDGTSTFKALKWASALAADVHDWAKQSEEEFISWMNANVQKVNDTDTQYFFSTDGDKLVVKKALYTNGVKGTETLVGEYEFLTAEEVAETLKGYYTKDEADKKFAPIGIDTGVHSVELAGGTNNGTLKLTVDGTATDNVAVTGLKSAAYVTVDSLNATAKGYADAVEAKLPTSADYGVLNVGEGNDAIEIGGTAQRPTVAVKLNETQGNVVLTTENGLKAAVDLSAYRLIADDLNTTYGLEYDSTNKVIKLVEGGEELSISAADFVKDGMLKSVEIDKASNTLTFTWNTDGGVTATEVKLSDIADIYTAAKNATEVQVAISNTNEISATLVTGGVTESKIAAGAVTVDKIAANAVVEGKIADGAVTTNKIAANAVTSGKLAATVNADIAKGVEAQGWGDHAQAGYAMAGDLGDLAGKDKITNADVADNAAIAHTKIDGLGALATKDNITASLVTDFATEVAKVKVNNAAHADSADNATKAADADKLGGQLPEYYATAKSVSDLKDIARTGSIYDVEEVSEDANGVQYLVLDCNW